MIRRFCRSTRAAPPRSRRTAPLLLVALALLLAAAAPARAEEHLVDVITANIRYDEPDDGPNRWRYRRDALAAALREAGPGIICTQEGDGAQRAELAARLPGYGVVEPAEPRDPELFYPAIFVDRALFSVLEAGDVWLSKTPDRAGSRLPGSKYPRLMSWARLLHRPSGQELLVANTHLDERWERVRLAQGCVLGEQLAELDRDGLPLVLAGDFNTRPTSELRGVLRAKLPGLRDPWKTLGRPEADTAHGFGRFKGSGRIDWILHDAQLRPVAVDLIDSGPHPAPCGTSRFLSDHHFVRATLGLRARPRARGRERSAHAPGGTSR